MRHLDEVVDLGAAADDGLAQRRSIDAGAGADLDVVLDAGDARLRNLAVHGAIALALEIEGETEAIRADHAVRLEDDPISDQAALADDGAGPEDAVLPHLGEVENARAGMESGPRPDAGARPDVGSRQNRGGGMHFRARVDPGARLDPARDFQLSMKKRARLGKGDVGLRRDETSRSYRHAGGVFLRDDHRARSAPPELAQVARVGIEGDVLGRRARQRRHSGNPPRPFPAELRTDAARQFRKREVRHGYFFGAGAGFFSGVFFSGVFPATPPPKRSL